MNKLLTRVLFLLLLSAKAGYAVPALNEALRSQEAGDYAKAASLYLPLATKGYAVAQFKLGECYENGQVVLQDSE